MPHSDRRLGLLCCLLAVGQAFQPPRLTPRHTPPRHTMHADAASILDSTLALANAEEFLGGIVGFLPLIAIPGVLVGIPFLVFNRLKDLEGDAYTETVFTEKQPPRRPGAEPVVRKKDIDMSYAELEQKYGEATLFKEDAPPKPPVNEPFALPELPSFPSFGGDAPAPPKYEAPPSQPEEEFALPELKLPSLPSFPSFGGDASPPKYDDAAPAPPEEEFKLPEISLPSFPNPFGGGAPEPVFAEEEDEPAAEEPFKLPEVKFPWQ